MVTSRAATGTRLPCRVEAQHRPHPRRCWTTADARATFFTLGWIAERYPGWCGASRRRPRARKPRLRAPARAATRSPKTFLADIRHAKAVLEDIIGQAVRGYRAPSFSIGRRQCVGVRMHRRSGLSLQLEHLPDPPRSLRHAGRAAFRARGATRAARSAGGDDARAGATTGRRAAAAISACCPTACRGGRSGASTPSIGSPAMFYFHPWEIDPDQPRVPGLDCKTRFRHYVNLGRMAPRLVAAARDFRWDRVDRVFLDGAIR